MTRLHPVHSGRVRLRKCLVGRFAGGAVEDDDLLYSGSGPKEDITFAVSIAKLRADFKHTNLKE